jgi:hypothetical protein
MQQMTFLVLIILVVSLAGCKNQYFFTDDYPHSQYPNKYTQSDITLFNSGLTNYRQWHGFDVFRENGSFNNGRFYH